MKLCHHFASSSGAGVRLLSLLLACPLLGQAAADSGQVAPLLSFPGTHLPQPAVWVFGPVEGNAQSFRVSITGFDSKAQPEGLVLTIPDQAAPRFSGMPDLPLVSILVRCPAGKSVRAEVNPPRWIVIPGIRVAPAESPALDETTGEASETRLVRTPAATVYGIDEFWPVDLVRVEEAWIGTEKRIRLECALMQHNPASQLLRYTLVLEGRLLFETAEQSGKP